MKFFRRILGSKIGGFIAIAFLAIIGLAFAAGDITGHQSFNLFGQKASEVARIGSRTVTTNDLQTRSQIFFERLREENPQLTMAQFISDGGVRRVADELIANRALIAWGEAHGIRISKALVDAEIASNPAFVDATGNFSEKVFRELLAQRRISEKDLRDDILGQLVQQQMLAPVGAGARTPEAMVAPYAATLLEQRTGELIAVPSALYAPRTPAPDAELRAYYAAHPDEFTLPEQRKLRYALVDLTRFNAQATPSDAELQQAYKAKAAQYKAREARDFSQLILATEAAARDAAAKVAQGQSLAAVASAAGLSASRIDNVSQDALAEQTSADLARAGFAAAKGGVVGPIRSPLGWTVLRVEDVREIAGKSFEQARAELIPEVRQTKARQLFSEFLNTLDGKLGEGVNFTELARANQLTIVETPLLTADGKNLNDIAYHPDAAVTALLQKGFAMSADDDPQVVQVKPDEQAAILQVGEVVASGPPPFERIKNAVQVAWSLSKGAEEARKKAEALNQALNKGEPAATVLARLDLTQAPRQPLDAERGQLNRQGGQVPPPLQALFALKAGKAQLLPLENNRGFVVVRLDRITPHDPSGNPNVLASTRGGLANVLGGEYARQFVGAVQKDIGIQRNDAAIAAVEKALRDANGGGAQ